MADETIAKDKASYSPSTAFFFLVNYILGTGFLGIPYVMYHSGILSCTLTLIVVTCFNCFGALWILESMARAHVSYAYHYAAWISSCVILGNTMQFK